MFGHKKKQPKDKIFNPFLTLNLPVVKKSVEQLGGMITFESEKDKGTKFIIR